MWFQAVFPPVLSPIQKHMVTHGTNGQIAAEEMVTHSTRRVFDDGQDDLPLHKLVVSGELTLRFLPDSIRYGGQEAELASCVESISSMRRTDKS